MIVNNEIEIEEIINNGNAFYPDRIKFCIDKKRRVVSIDKEMHIDMEHELYDNGSEYEDIFGGDILFGEDAGIIWEAHPNIARNHELGVGFGRELTDSDIISELEEILVENIKGLEAYLGDDARGME